MRFRDWIKMTEGAARPFFRNYQPPTDDFEAQRQAQIAKARADREAEHQAAMHKAKMNRGDGFYDMEYDYGDDLDLGKDVMNQYLSQTNNPRAPDDYDRRYTGQHPDALFGDLNGWTFCYDPDTQKFDFAGGNVKHCDIPHCGRVMGRIKLPGGAKNSDGSRGYDHLQYFHTNRPMISLWDTSDEDIKSMLAALEQHPKASKIKNIHDAHIIVNGDYVGTAKQFLTGPATASSKEGSRQIEIGGRTYSVNQLPALLHTLPKLSPERQAIEDYLQHNNDADLTIAKDRMVKVTRKNPWSASMEKSGMIGPGQKWWAPHSDMSKQ
jgi:hypothetical protein